MPNLYAEIINDYGQVECQIQPYGGLPNLQGVMESIHKQTGRRYDFKIKHGVLDEGARVRGLERRKK